MTSEKTTLVASAGSNVHVTISGAFVAFTVTVKEQAFVLPALSVAVHLTVVVPSANDEPDAGEQLPVAPAQLSPTTGAAKPTVRLVWPGGTLMITLPEQLIVGGVVSSTMILA